MTYLLMNEMIPCLADTEVAPIRPNRLSNVGNPIAIEEDRGLQTIPNFF